MAAGPGPLDVRMPHCDGLSVLMDLRRLEHPPVVAMLTTFDVEEYLSAALRGERRDSSSRTRLRSNWLTPSGSWFRSGRDRSPGGPYGDPRLCEPGEPGGQGDRESRQTLEDRESPLGRATAAAESLTTREREVLELLAEGLSNTEIGKRLYIGTTTVKDHVTVLLGKLGVANRVHPGWTLRRSHCPPATPASSGTSSAPSASSAVPSWTSRSTASTRRAPRRSPRNSRCGVPTAWSSSSATRSRTPWR